GGKAVLLVDQVSVVGSGSQACKGRCGPADGRNIAVGRDAEGILLSSGIRHIEFEAEAGPERGEKVEDLLVVEIQSPDVGGAAVDIVVVLELRATKRIRLDDLLDEIRHLFVVQRDGDDRGWSEVPLVRQVVVDGSERRQVRIAAGNGEDAVVDGGR